MYRCTVALPADHSARAVTRPHPQAAEPAALWHRAGSAVAALFGRSAARAEAGVDHRDREETHQVWRNATLGSGPGLR
jgi:hypothetical protein